MAMNKGLLLVLLTAIISGVSIFLNSFGVKGFDSSVFTFAKNIIVALLLFGIILGFKQWNEIKKLTRKQWLKLGAIGLIGGSIPFLLFFKGLQLTTGTNGAFIHKTLFVFASVFALFFLKEKLNKGFIIGAALLLIGNFLILSPDFGFSIAHLLIVAATVFWAAENTISKKVLEETSGNIVAFGRMFFGSLFILAFLFITGKANLVLNMNLSQYFWILVTGGMLLLYVLTYYNGLKKVSVSTATSILAMGSPITMVLGWIFLGNALPIIQLSGIFIVGLGVVSILWYNTIFKQGVTSERN